LIVFLCKTGNSLLDIVSRNETGSYKRQDELWRVFTCAVCVATNEISWNKLNLVGLEVVVADRTT